MKKVLIAVLLLVSVTKIVFSQEDSTDYAINDSIIPKEGAPHYIGVNIAPLVKSIVGGYDNDLKLSAIYKHNFGEKNLRTSINYLTIGNPSQFNSQKLLTTTDSSQTSRYYNSDYKHVDIRFGFEELRGYRFSRLHIGGDLIIGYSQFKDNYFSAIFEQDSSLNYVYNSIIGEFDTGFKNGDYVNLGINISFGFDWFLSDEFLFTFQLTPQFNYYIFNQGSKTDPYFEYGDFNNFANFNPWYFDVYLIHKF